MAAGLYRMKDAREDSEDPRIEQILEVIFSFAAGDLTARGTLAYDNSALDGVIAGINILGEEMQANVAETQHAQRTMVESEALLRGVFDSVLDGIVVADIETRQNRMVNDTMCRMLGYSREELLAMSITDMHPEQERHRIASDFARLARSGSGLSTSIPMQRKDGSVFYADVNAGPATINGVASLAGVFRDISERRQSEQALKESEEKFRQLFEDSLDALMVIKPPSWRFTDSNRAMLQLFGASSAEEFTGLGPWDLSPQRQPDGGSSAEMGQEMVATTLREGSCFFEWEHQRLNGESFAATVQLTRMGGDGQFYVMGTVRDISERRRAEEKIQKLNKSLEEKVLQLQKTQRELEQHRAHLEQEVAQRTASLMEAQRIAHIGNCEWDLVNNTLSCSDEIYRIFGLTPQQFGRNYEAFLSLVHPQDRQLVDDSVHDALQRQGPYSIEYRILRPDGTQRHVYQQAEVIRGEDGQPISMIGTQQDITERKQAEQSAIDESNFSNTLIASQPDLFFVLDSAGRYIRWNDRLREILGLSDAELAVTDALDSIHESDRSAVAQIIQEAFEQGAATIEARLITKRGIRDYMFSARSADTAKGKYLIGIAINITDRKLAEAEVQKLQETLREQVLHDPLTGLYNRRYLDETIERELSRAERNKQPVGIVMCDLDHFKRVNDTHGHLAGDEVLRVFAELLEKNARGSDIVCRFGGEEFVMFLPGMPSAAAYQRAEQLRRELAATQITLGEAVIMVTASFGVASFPENGDTMDSLISAVDAAMYQAKETGRDRVVISSVRAAVE